MTKAKDMADFQVPDHEGANEMYAALAVLREWVRDGVIRKANITQFIDRWEVLCNKLHDGEQITIPAIPMDQRGETDV